jgi:hypothetical protein
MEWNEERLLLNIRQADTDDLLDRITAYRAGMEPDAVNLIEQELHKRGVTATRIAEHEEACKREWIYNDDGTAKVCSLCRKPAIRQTMGWFKLLWLVPVLPRTLWLCKVHARHL